MLIDIKNLSESLLIIEYNNKTYEISSTATEQIDVDSLNFELTAYMKMPEDYNLELDKGLKNKAIQKGFDKLYELVKKMIVQCKVTYSVHLNSNNAELIFANQPFGKEQTFIDDFLEMPAELSSFAELECDNADISVCSCKVLNKKEFFRAYRRAYFFVNWNLLSLSLFMYLPSYFKQKRMVSEKHLMKLLNEFYSVSQEEREALFLKYKTKSDNTQIENSKSGGCFKTFLQIGIFVLILIVLLIIGIIWLAKNIFV